MSDKRQFPFTQDQAIELFEYRDGLLFWKPRPESEFVSDRLYKHWHSRNCGKKAGGINKGYDEVFFGKQRVGVHRIVFMIHHGYIPEQVDHIDGNKSNNQIENLRASTATTNQYNKPRNTMSSSGAKGVYWHIGISKWVASIRINKKLQHLGSFHCLLDAVSERIRAEIKYHGEYRTQR